MFWLSYESFSILCFFIKKASFPAKTAGKFSTKKKFASKNL